ncbi:MAG: hypothetical protein Kow0069_26460 [Promethearchaeota archaeon]
MILACLATLASFGVPRAAGFNEYVYESDLVAEKLLHKTVTWRIDRAFGYFADLDLHQDSLVRLEVTNVSEADGRFVVTQRTKEWLDIDWSAASLPFELVDYGVDYADEHQSSENITNYRENFIFDRGNYSDTVQPFWFLVTPKYWSHVAMAVSLGYEGMELNDWGTYESRLENTTITVENEWFDLQFIDVVTIRMQVDEDNYEYLKFSRAEGLLLTRRVHIRDSSGVTGDFQITLVDKNFAFDYSPWYYVVLFAIIFGSIMTVAIVISVLISRRKERQRKLDY